MKNRKLATIVALILCLAFLAQPVQTQAASNKLLSYKGITWDLKAGKTITYYTYVSGAGFIKQKAKFSKFKKSASVYRGYCQIEFDIKLTQAVKLSKKQIKKICIAHGQTSNWQLAPNYFYFVGNKKTGAGFKDAAFTATKEYTSTKKYKAGKYSFVIANQTLHAKLICPDSHSDLSIIWGGTGAESVDRDIANSLFSGKIKLNKAKGIYTTKKGVIHGMKVVK